MVIHTGAAFGDLSSLDAVQNAVDWPSLYEEYKSVGSSADGVLAGAFVERISWLLANQWKMLPVLRELTDRDPSFLEFIRYYLGSEAVPFNEGRRILRLATKACPSKREIPLCRLIAKEVSSSLIK
jgi:hypothetical protein